MSLHLNPPRDTGLDRVLHTRLRTHTPTSTEEGPVPLWTPGLTDTPRLGGPTQVCDIDSIR